jgi:uncharacterized membrane-anchored protein
MPPIQDHPLRYALANELHARPFPPVTAPCRAAFLSVKRPTEAVARDRGLDRAHLLGLLDRFGAPHPQPDATHWFGQLGRHRLKWESHTEFVTYTLFSEDEAGEPFDPATFRQFPEDWLAQAPGVRITSALIRVEPGTDIDAVRARVEDWFVPESLALSSVLDGAAVISGDFRIDSAGHVRFGVFVRAGTGARRTGRIVQRLCEIETYKAMSMLGLARAREMAPRMAEVDGALAALVGEMRSEAARADVTLRQLLENSAELEDLIARSSFRFGATAAYEALVNQRIAVLREERFDGRQTFAEFMARRFDPAMRTVISTERRLQDMARAAQRAGELLRTRVDVERSAQNQKLLESMDRRADLQLRLQKTVEGFSVVAISYYALSLMAYLTAPVAGTLGLEKAVLTALLVPPVVIAVWLVIRRIRRAAE